MKWFLFCYWYEPDAPSDPVGLVRLWALARQLSQRGDSVTVFPPRYRFLVASARICGCPDSVPSMVGLAPHFLRDSLFRCRLRTSLLVKARCRVLPVDGKSSPAVARETVWSPVHL